MTGNPAEVKKYRGGTVMKTVFICKDPFPYSGACCSLLLKMLRSGLNKELDDIHIICSYDLKQRDNSQKLEKDVTIHRLYWWDGISLKDLIRNIWFHPVSASKGVVIKFQKKMGKKHEFELDQDVIRQIKKILREIGCDSNDVIVPVAGFYETVTAALEWKKDNKSRVISYQVDPCSTNKAYSTKSLEMRQAYERNMYHQSDFVITTPIIKKELALMLPHTDMDKTVAMEFPNLELSRLQFKGRQEAKDNERKEISCVFCGMVYQGVRDPGFAIKLFSGLKNDTKLVMVGVTRKEASAYVPEQDIGNNITFCGYLPADETQDYIETADFLVNIGNKVLNQVPSKLFTYIATGKPIINLCTSRNCPTIPYLDKYLLSLNVFEDDILEARKQVESFIANSVGKRVAAEEIAHNFYECSAEYCANVMNSQIRKLAN